MTLGRGRRKFGPVKYVRVPRWEHTGNAKGIAYVEFSNEAGAKAAATAESIEVRVGHSTWAR